MSLETLFLSTTFTTFNVKMHLFYFIVVFGATLTFRHRLLTTVDYLSYWISNPLRLWFVHNVIGATRRDNLISFTYYFGWLPSILRYFLRRYVKRFNVLALTVSVYLHTLAKWNRKYFHNTHLHVTFSDRRYTVDL